MKKFKFLVLSLLIVLFSNFSLVNAEDNIHNKVFKLISFEYNEDYNTFLMYGYGSATLIDDDKVLTNAHVVLDHNDEIIGKYSLCKTYDFRKEPRCFSKLKLLAYDEGLDLALLEILDSTEGLPEPVEIKERELNIGDSVTAYGYPSNGGNTVTLTQGKISGFDAPFYKIDANLDGGSSGGALFDEDNNFVGVPSAVSYGDTTLGEVIPASSVRLFLENLEKKKEIKDYYSFKDEEDKKEFEKFNNFIDNTHKKFGLDYIDTGFIKLNNLSKYGFRISDILTFDYDKDSQSQEYLLNSDSYNTKVYIKHIPSLGNIKFTAKDGNNLIKMFERTINKEDKKEFEDTKIKYKKIKLKGEDVILDLELNLKNKDIKLGINSDSGISISIESNLKYKKELNKALLMIFKGFERVENYEDTIKELDFFGIKIKETPGFTFFKKYNWDSGRYEFLGISEAYKSNKEGFENDYAFVSVETFYYDDDVDFSNVSIEDYAQALKKDNFIFPGLKDTEISVYKNSDFIYINGIIEENGFNLYAFITFSEIKGKKRYFLIQIMTPTKNKNIEPFIEKLIKNTSTTGEYYLKPKINFK